MPARIFERDGWRVSGDLQIVGDRSAAAVDELAARFLRDAQQWEITVPRPMTVVGTSMATGELQSDEHAHREAQLFYVARGEVSCATPDAMWIVPPGSALWLPGGVLHRIHGRAPLEGYSVFVQPEAARGLPTTCSGMAVTPLLRELFVRLASRPPLYDPAGPDGRIVGVLFDELAAAPLENHRLPMPRDPRLRKLVDGLLANPASGAKMGTWAKRTGMAERTLNRLLVSETGLSFGRWRQQLHIVLALQKLSRGSSVQSVAEDLGYESASSFVTMFRKAMGRSPARYFASRLRAESGQ